MNIENICRFKKVLDRYLQSSRTKSFIKIKLFQVYGTFSKKCKKSLLRPLDLVRQYNSPNPYCSPSIIIQGNFHLSKHPRERFDRFFIPFFIDTEKRINLGKRKSTFKQSRVFMSFIQQLKINLLRDVGLSTLHNCWFSCSQTYSKS